MVSFWSYPHGMLSPRSCATIKINTWVEWRDLGSLVGSWGRSFLSYIPTSLVVVYCASYIVLLNGILMHSSGILSSMVIYDEADCALMWILWYTVSRSILPIKIWKSDYLVFIDMNMWSSSWRHKPYKNGLLRIWWYCCWKRVHRLMVRSSNVGLFFG